MFSSINKKLQLTIIKNTKRSSEKKHMKDIKIFLRKKKTKGEKRPGKDNQNFTEEEKEKRCNKNHLSEEQKQKLDEYRRNYYLTHKKYLLRDFVDFLKILGQLKRSIEFWVFSGIMYYKKFLKFLCYELVLETLENSKNVGHFFMEMKSFLHKIFFDILFFLIVLERPISHYWLTSEGSD